MPTSSVPLPSLIALEKDLLLRLIADNAILTFVSPNPDHHAKLKDDLAAILQNPAHDRVIDVEVIGTEERDQNTIFAYTVYVISISIGQIENKVYLRFSELKAVKELVLKELTGVRITNLL